MGEKAQREGNSLIVENRLYRDDEIDLYELWLVIWRRKWLILSVTFLFLIGAFVYIKVAPRKYVVEAVLLPNRIVVDNRVFTTTTTTLKALLNDKALLSKFFSVKFFNGDKIKWTISTPRGTSLLTVSYTTTKPSEFVKQFSALLSFLRGYKSFPDLVVAMRKVKEYLSDIREGIKKDNTVIKALISEIDRLSILKNNISTQINKLDSEVKELTARREIDNIKGADRLLYVNLYQLMSLRMDSLMRHQETVASQIVSYKEKLARLQSELSSLKLRESELVSQLKGFNLFDIIQPPVVISVSRRSSLILAVALVAGLFVGVFIVFFLSWLEAAKARMKQT
ncbi:MAG: hypothetical protein J7L41_02715 [Synergistetes bacterium]|nr:hypothetical protein [Synergistota bacterium]